MCDTEPVGVVRHQLRSLMGNGESVFSWQPSRSGQRGVATYIGTLPWFGGLWRRP